MRIEPGLSILSIWIMSHQNFSISVTDTISSTTYDHQAERAHQGFDKVLVFPACLELQKQPICVMEREKHLVGHNHAFSKVHNNCKPQSPEAAWRILRIVPLPSLLHPIPANSGS